MNNPFPPAREVQMHECKTTIVIRVQGGSRSMRRQYLNTMLDRIVSNNQHTEIRSITRDDDDHEITVNAVFLALAVGDAPYTTN